MWEALEWWRLCYSRSDQVNRYRSDGFAPLNELAPTTFAFGTDQVC